MALYNSGSSWHDAGAFRWAEPYTTMTSTASTFYVMPTIARPTVAVTKPPNNLAWLDEQTEDVCRLARAA